MPKSPEAPSQDPNKCRDIDILLLVRRAAAAVTQRDKKNALIRLGLIRSEVEMIGEFLTDQLPPSNPGLGTDGIQPAGISIEQLQIMGTATKG
jgi:hypothetical protein